jgi:hypothetical protein
MPSKGQTLYPTIGEVLNEAAAMFGSKPEYTDKVGSPSYQSARKINKLKGYGAFKIDYSSIGDSINVVFAAPFSSENDVFSDFLTECGHAIIGQYIQMIREYPLDGFTRKESIPWLVENHVCKFICDAISSIARAHADKWSGLDLFIDAFPMRNAFAWLEKTFPCFEEFKNSYGVMDEDDWYAIKIVRDKVWKWKAGKVIPGNSGLWGDAGVLQLFSEQFGIDKKDRIVINEVFFIARALQVFFRKTKHLKTLENLQLMSANKYRIVPEAVLLKSLHGNADEAMDQALPYLRCIEELRSLLVNQGKREAGDNEKISELLLRAQQMTEGNPQYSPNWWELYRLRGRWHEFNSETEKAILSYKEALDGYLYSGSPHAKKAFREALTLCCKAYLEGRRVNSMTLKPYLKRLKAQGRLFDFYPPWQLDEEDISKEEAGIMASYYWQYFPESMRF